MSLQYERYVFDDQAAGFAPVLARDTDLDAAHRYGVLDPAFVTAIVGEVRGTTQKILRPGYFAGTIPSSTKLRILPRTRLAAASATNAATLTVVDARPFVPGDVLSVIPPLASVAITSASGGWAANDTITVTINGFALVTTVVSGDIGGSLAATNTNLGVKIAAAINAHPYLTLLVSAAANAGTVSIWAKDFETNYTLTAADTGANGTATASASALAPNQSVGTIAAAGVNTATNVITLTGNASLALPITAPIGVAASSPVNLGLLSPTQPIDLLYRANQHYGLYTDAVLYRGRMPYLDTQLERLFPSLTYV